MCRGIEVESQGYPHVRLIGKRPFAHFPGPARVPLGPPKSVLAGERACHALVCIGVKRPLVSALRVFNSKFSTVKITRESP
jgi:hypothetical protein